MYLRVISDGPWWFIQRGRFFCLVCRISSHSTDPERTSHLYHQTLLHCCASGLEINLRPRKEKKFCYQYTCWNKKEISRNKRNLKLRYLSVLWFEIYQNGGQKELHMGLIHWKSFFNILVFTFLFNVCRHLILHSVQFRRFRLSDHIFVIS